MLTPVDFARAFLETFDGSAVNLFQKYLRRNSGVVKWMIAADFSLSDPRRSHDCFAFTFWPYDDTLDQIAADTVAALPKDLKKSKSLTPEAVAWLRDARRFHVIVTFNQQRPVFYNGPGSNALAVAREHIAVSLEMLERMGNEGELGGMNARFSSLNDKARANGFNTKLLANIWLLGRLFAILTLILGRERRSEMIGWFPDRDDITNWCDGIWRDYVFGDIHVLCDAFGIDMSNTRTVAAAPDRCGPQEIMWFDYMIRAADWRAGVIGTWNRTHNLVPGDQPKNQDILEQVIADAENIVILNCNLKKDGLQFSRIVVHRDPAPT
jgi:hypothetical protein